MSDRYRKEWHYIDQKWLIDHVHLLEQVVPGYLVRYGCEDESMFIEMKILSGTPASVFEHTDEFIKKIYAFCIQNIHSTLPYVHGDWVLSNIIINDDNIQMCDWDNLGIYPLDEVQKKLVYDLESAFGKKFKEVINDPTIF